MDRLPRPELPRVDPRELRENNFLRPLPSSNLKPHLHRFSLLRLLIVNPVLIFLFFGFAGLAQSPTPAAPAASGTEAAGVRFRSDGPMIKTEVAPPHVTDAATVGESQKEMGSLADQKDTLESELRYAKAKLEGARNRLNAATAANHPEEADKWEQEVKDWDARVKSLQNQTSEVDNEVQGAIKEMEPSAPEENIILPGDNLELFVVEDASFNGRYQVRRGGYIIMPAVGRIGVAGKTLQGAEAEVRKALESTQLLHATVMVEKVEGADIETGAVIFLCGAFRNAHPFRIPPGTKATVVNVILSCGGVADGADLTRVKVMRLVENKSVVEEVNVERMLDGGGLTSDLTLNDGDVLLVPGGALNAVFVTGGGGRPGAQVIRGSGLSAFSAILNAGGLARFADPKKVYVLRASPDGTKVRIPVNIVAIERGHAPDLPLVGGDILIVPEKFFSF